MRIVLADDHELVRAGLRPYLADLGSDVDIVEVVTFEQAVDALSAPAPDGPAAALAIINLHMPGMSGDWARRLRDAAPGLPVVILSGSLSLDDILLCYREGVAGYLPKTFGGPSMVAALRVILTGQRFFPVFALEALLQKVDSLSARQPVGGGEGLLLAKLSVRERDILGLMIEGGTNKEIARRLEVQEITVKVHLRNIYRKLGAANRAQAVRIALEDGWRGML